MIKFTIKKKCVINVISCVPLQASQLKGRRHSVAVINRHILLNETRNQNRRRSLCDSTKYQYEPRKPQDEKNEKTVTNSEIEREKGEISQDNNFLQDEVNQLQDKTKKLQDEVLQLKKDNEQLKATVVTLQSQVKKAKEVAQGTTAVTGKTTLNNIHYYLCKEGYAFSSVGLLVVVYRPPYTTFLPTSPLGFCGGYNVWK